MENVVFTYQRTKEDVIKQNLWQLFWRNNLVKILTFLFPLLGVFFLINSIITETNPIVYLAVAYLILYPVVNYFLIVMRVNRLFKDPNMQFDVTTFDFADDGITISSKTHEDQGKLLLEFDRIMKVYNTKSYIYIYIDNRTSIMVNKTILKPHESDFILQLLKDKTIATACNY